MTRKEREKEIVKAAEKMLDGNPNYMSTRELAFVLGAHWADEHPHWISVEDELPPRFVLDPNDSLFVLTYGLHTKVAFYKYDKGEWVGNTEVTHWMPLPQAPKSGSSEKPNNCKKKGGER